MADKHDTRRQDKYVQARVVDLLPPREAARKAGYEDSTKIADIERKGGAVDLKLEAALEKHGLTVDKLMVELNDGLSLSKQDGAKNRDLNAHNGY